MQNLIHRDSAEIWKLVEDQGAYFYVCGGTRMGNDVMKTMEEMARKHGGLSEDDAKKYIKNLQANHRYVQELWS